MANKTVILGVTGGIAAYKSCEIVSRLRKLGYSVRVIMTQAATEFVTPLTFETLSNYRVITDMFDKGRGYDVEHISYAKLADVFLVAPATANFIAKLASGVADDMLTSTILATTAPIVVCPAMNTKMYENAQTAANIDALKKRGVIFIEPDSGMLACGDVGKGRMSEPKDIVEFVDGLLTPKPDFRGKTVLITSGATQEPVDAVRFLTNRSSGKMGAALADAVIDRGGSVIFVAGKMSVPMPIGAEVITVNTTDEMYSAVINNLSRADIVIKAAAPSDYKVKNYSEQKIKANTLTLELEKNVDIAKEVGMRKGNKKLVVFAAETEDLIKNAYTKLESKNADIIVANDITLEGAGFGTDTNIATIIKRGGGITTLEKMTKRTLADVILDALLDD